MMNPDGVVVGNSRVSLMGKDMNRKWANTQILDPYLSSYQSLEELPSPEEDDYRARKKNNQKPQANFYPSVEAVKSMIHDLKHRVFAFIDLHGHSKKEGSFFYGNYVGLSDQLPN